MGRAVTQLFPIGPAQLDEVWRHVSHFIDAAYRETDRIMPDMLPWLREGKGLLWVVWDGSMFVCAVVTSLEPHLSGLSCRVAACGGNGMGEWLHHMVEIEDYARREGCVKVWLEGRKGWSRALEGYRPFTVSMEKRLDVMGG